MKSIFTQTVQTSFQQTTALVKSISGVNREMLRKYLSEILFFENTTQKGKIWR